ncbi:MAG: XTP/dITP diphosphohydrolase [Salibacteraceae bacterium]|jgi:XTP/dITP diphosphohydrolase
MSLIFATNNLHKLAEIRSAVPQLSIQGLSESGVNEDIPETGTTLQENARQKARHIYDKLGENCFADDTGLEVSALNGAPGVYSARYAGPDGNFEDNNRKLLGALKESVNRKAQFRTVICLIQDGNEHYFEGICPGDILEEYAGSKGFGYDPIFKPYGFKESFAEMSMETKNEISHRGLAVKKLISFLNTL